MLDAVPITPDVIDWTIYGPLGLWAACTTWSTLHLFRKYDKQRQQHDEEKKDMAKRHDAEKNAMADRHRISQETQIDKIHGLAFKLNMLLESLERRFIKKDS
jgi:hypothetical protein